jgi:2-keto-3-deoxy-6-phosphogluconate aldolase
MRLFLGWGALAQESNGTDAGRRILAVTTRTEAFAAMFGGGDALKLSPARRLSVASLRVAHRARIPRRLIPAGGVAPDNRRRS